MSESVSKTTAVDCQVDTGMSYAKQTAEAQVRLLRLIARCASQLLREREASDDNSQNVPGDSGL